MNEEEIKAIKMCRLLLNGDITLHIIDDDGGTAYAGTVNKTYNDDLETVLNLIEKQKAEIETNDILLKCEAELSEELKAEIEKKDKIIDEMADALVEAELYNPYNIPEFFNISNRADLGYKEVIEYFENKVKESK